MESRVRDGASLSSSCSICLFSVIVAGCAFSSAAEALVKSHDRGKSRSIIIFVHGIVGGESTFYNAKAKVSWPELIQSDQGRMRLGPSLSDYGTAYLLYPTTSESLLTPKETTVRLHQQLIDAGVFSSYDNIHLVCHSLGGLICKSLYLQLNLAKKTFAEKLTTIFLIAVPSQGNPEANWVQYIDAAYTAATAVGSTIGVQIPPGPSKEMLDGLKTIDINPTLNLEIDWKYALSSRKKTDTPHLLRL